MICYNSYYEKVGNKVTDITDEIPFDLPVGWSWCRINDVLDIFTGATFKKEEALKNKSGIRVLRGGNILNNACVLKDNDIYINKSLVKDSILLKKNDIISPAVTSIENVGKMARIDFDMNDTTAGGFVFIMRPYFDNDVLSKYLIIALSNPVIVNLIKGITKKSGSAFYNIGKERLLNIVIPIAPTREQERIINKLSELEPLLADYDKLETTERTLTENLPNELRKSILQYAIQGKLVPQDPNDEPASVLLERIRKEKEQQLGKKSKKNTDSFIYINSDDNSYYEKQGELTVCIDNEIPFEIPDSWTWCRVGSVYDIRNGFTPLRTEKKFWDNGSVPWFTVEDIRTQGTLIKNTKQHINKCAVTDDRIVPADSFLLCCTASVGVYAQTLIPLTTNQQFNALSVKKEYKELIRSDYLYHIGDYFEDLLHSVAGTTTFEFISVKKLSMFLIPVPPINEQHKICEKIKELYDLLNL